jgi:hypothetical protein
MKPRTILLFLAIAGTVFSCIPSLYPLYRQKDLVVDGKLEGIFAFEDENDYWEIEHLGPEDVEGLKGDWKYYKSGFSYRLKVMEDGEMEEFALHMLYLGEDMYLDFFPVDYSISPDFLGTHLAPTHIFAKAEISEEYLILHFFDIDWIKDLIDENRIKISHLNLEDDRVLLMAKTEELQKFIVKFANDSSTFIEADTLPRFIPEQIADL